jgi:acyl carrier protein
MDRGGIRALLTRLLQEIGKVPADKIREGATVESDLRMESVAFIELQVALEEELDIEIDPLEIITRNELGAIVDYLFECTGG